VTPGWRVEHPLSSRQDTQLSSRGRDRCGLTVERYLVGIQKRRVGPGSHEVLSASSPRRDALSPPASAENSPDLRFTAGLSLGVKHAVSGHIALRAEARGFFVNGGQRIRTRVARAAACS
jgi:hypothetical protein